MSDAVVSSSSVAPLPPQATPASGTGDAELGSSPELSPVSPASAALPRIVPVGFVVCDQCDELIPKAHVAQHESTVCAQSLTSCLLSRDHHDICHLAQQHRADAEDEEEGEEVETEVTRAECERHVEGRVGQHVLYLMDVVDRLQSQLSSLMSELAVERRRREEMEEQIKQVIKNLAEKVDHAQVAVSRQQRSSSRAPQPPVTRTADLLLLAVCALLSQHFTAPTSHAAHHSAQSSRMTVLRTASGRVVQRRVDGQQRDDDYPAHFRSSLQYSPTLSAAPSPILDKPLTLSASAWKPAAKPTSSSSSPPSDAVDAPSDAAALSKRIQSTLNKLTPTNYEKLSHELLRLLSSVSSSSQLLKLTSLVFDKALQDIFYGHMYARLCRQLSDGGVGLAAAADDAGGGGGGGAGKGFRWYLLNKCQEEFERGGKELTRAEAERKEMDDKSEEKKEEKQESKEETQSASEQKQEEQQADGAEEAEQRRAASKRRMISSLRFIGELFMVDLVGTNIMIACCQQLLSVVELQQGDASEDSIQGLLRLLLTVGRKLDVRENEQRLRRLWEVVQRESEQESKHSSRGRFALLDLLEARRSGWKEREGQKGQTASDEVLHKTQTAAGGAGSAVVTRIGFSGNAHEDSRGSSRQRDRERDPQQRERERERERELIPHLTAGVRLEQANAMAATVSRWQPGAKKKPAAATSGHDS